MMYHIGALVADFRTSSLGMRDKLYLEKDRLRAFLDALPADTPLQEIVALCTCNRIEIFYVCEQHETAAAWLSRFLAAFHTMPLAHLEKALTNYRCEDAVRHLFRVASGVESMVFGEHEILGQVRDAYFLCAKKQTTDSYLNRLFQQAIATGKKVRSRTGAGQGALSIASIAVERMTEIAGDLATKRILVVGLGAIGLRALKRIVVRRPAAIGLSNRTGERARRLCDHFEAEFVTFDRFTQEIVRFDIVILATASPKFILHRDDIAARRQAQRQAPLLVVDLGAPCNADPLIGSIEGVTLVSIDTLRETAEHHLDLRKNELSDIEDIIERQVREFARWYKMKCGCECSHES
jgi:glutamyl-tRNA reductase